MAGSLYPELSTECGTGMLFAVRLDATELQDPISRPAALREPLDAVYVPLVCGEEASSGFETADRYHDAAQIAEPVLRSLNRTLVDTAVTVERDSLTSSYPYLTFKIAETGVLRQARRSLLEAAEPHIGINPSSDNPNGWWGYAGYVEDDEREVVGRLPHSMVITDVVANPVIEAKQRGGQSYVNRPPRRPSGSLTIA